MGRKNIFKRSIINDEISEVLSEALVFANERDLRYMELRSCEGRNLLDHSTKELKAIRDEIRNAGLNVSCLATPLFKWYPEGSKRSDSTDERVDLFHFSPELSKNKKKKYIEDAMTAADIFECEFVRIFAPLEHEASEVSWQESEKELYEYAISLSIKYGVVLAMENEYATVFKHINEFDEMPEVIHEGEVGLLMDVANSYYAGDKTSVQEIVNMLDSVRYTHLKDVDTASGKFVPFGTGDVPYAVLLERMHQNLTEDMYLSLEVHSESNKRKDCDVSASNLVVMLDELDLPYE